MAIKLSHPTHGTIGRGRDGMVVLDNPHLDLYSKKSQIKVNPPGSRLIWASEQFLDIS